MTRSVLCIVIAAPLPACHPHADEFTPSERRHVEVERGSLQAKRVTIDADNLSRSQIEELTRQMEGVGDVARAKVVVRKDEGGSTDLVIEIAGADLPTDDDLRREIATFPGMVEASIMVETVHPMSTGSTTAVSAGSKFVSMDRGSIEETRQRILADLAARGLDGKTTIEIEEEETPEGHRREVRVRVEAESSPAR